MAVYKRDDRIIHHIHIPKCGGTSLADMLKNSGWERWDLPIPKDLVKSDFMLPHRPAYGVDFMVGEVDEDVHTDHAHRRVWEQWGVVPEFQFTVVRNPYERFNSQMSQDAQEIGEESFEDSDMIQSLVMTFAFITSTPFELDGQIFGHGNPGFADNHYRRQVDFLGDDTHIYRLEDGFENLVSDLISRDILSDSEEILDLNKSAVKIEVPWLKPKYQELHQLFKGYYERDFETLGYVVRQVVLEGH